MLRQELTGYDARGAEADMLKRAFLIDNDAVFRLGLSRVLAHEFAIDTVGSYDHGRDHTDLVREARTDLLLLSPTPVAPESAAWLRPLLSSPREFLIVVLFAQHAAAAHELVALGADGFLLKPFTVSDLSNLVGGLRRDGGERAPAAIVAPIPAEQQPGGEARGLSDRELLVVRRTAAGRSSAQIAAEFGISIKTAERYRRSVFAKLGLQSVAELTKYAVREGYTTL